MYTYLKNINTISYLSLIKRWGSYSPKLHEHVCIGNGKGFDCRICAIKLSILGLGSEGNHANTGVVWMCVDSSLRVDAWQLSSMIPSPLTFSKWFLTGCLRLRLFHRNGPKKERIRKPAKNLHRWEKETKYGFLAKPCLIPQRISSNMKDNCTGWLPSLRISSNVKNNFSVNYVKEVVLIPWITSWWHCIQTHTNLDRLLKFP